MSVAQVGEESFDEPYKRQKFQTRNRNQPISHLIDIFAQNLCLVLL